MKKLIGIVLSALLFSGCAGIIPRITTDSPNTVPQSIDKSKAKQICKGKAVWSEVGVLLSCSKGYYNYDESYGKQERRMTIVERIKSFINGLVGWGFWGVILLIVLCPSLLGLIVGRIIEGTIGLARKSLDATVRAVQRARKNGVDLNSALADEQDADVKKYIAKIKDNKGIK